jgi:hypothetical protein
MTLLAASSPHPVRTSRVRLNRIRVRVAAEISVPSAWWWRMIAAIIACT